MKIIKKFIFCLVFVTTYAFAFPPVQPYQQGSYFFNVPQGWAVQVEEAQGMIFMQEDPNYSLSPTIIMLNTINYNNITLEQLFNEVVANAGLNNPVILSREDIDNTSLVVMEGSIEGLMVQMAMWLAIDYANNSVVFAQFSAPSYRFADLGGASLLFVTVGGQDPAAFEESQVNPAAQTSTGQSDPFCFDPSSVLYAFDHCVYERAIRNRVAVDPAVLTGQWSYALSVPTGDVWERASTGEIAYDAAGTGIALFFQSDGRYTLIYNFSSSQNFCSNSVKAVETGSYQFNGAQLFLDNGRFKADLSSCGGEPNVLEGNVASSFIDIAFPNANQLALVLSCDKHNYMISCNDFNTRYFVLERSQ